MATAPAVTVGVALGIAQDGDFILDHPSKGQLDSVSFTLATGFSPVTTVGRQAEVRRGRWSQLTDVIDAGEMSLNLLNLDRAFDPSHAPSPFYGRVLPGVAARIQAQATGFPPRTLMSGIVDGWTFTYDVDGYSTVIAECTDALGVLGAAEFNDWTSSTTTAPAKLGAACDRTEVAWSASARSFDSGVETLQSDAVSWGSNVLNYLQLVARSELGYLFADVENVLTFRNRNVAVGAAPAVAFGGAGIGFQTIAAKYGESLFSRVGVDREGGVKQTAQVADVAAWQLLYGPPRSLSLPGLLLSSDAQSLAMAEYLLDLYDTPRWQIGEISVELNGLSSADQDSVLSLDVTSVVSVSFTPNNVGDPIVQTVLVQGIGHALSPGSHVVRLSLIAAPVPFFRLDSATFGKLDSNVLAF